MYGRSDVQVNTGNVQDAVDLHVPFEQGGVRCSPAENADPIRAVTRPPESKATAIVGRANSGVGAR